MMKEPGRQREKAEESQEGRERMMKRGRERKLKMAKTASWQTCGRRKGFPDHVPPVAAAGECPSPSAGYAPSLHHRHMWNMFMTQQVCTHPDTCGTCS